MKVVILCGGQGTRLKEETQFKPKPMVSVGGKPILWHIMKHYSHYGFKDFILCLGYKGDMIKEYFSNYARQNNDFTLNLRSGRHDQHGTDSIEDWNITFVDTGSETQTGGRIKRIQKYIGEDEVFLATYGDGVSDVDLHATIEFHKAKGKIGTLTGLHPLSKYGTVDVDTTGVVTAFREKPILKDVVNGGFFVFSKRIFDFLTDDCILEREPFERLAAEREMVLYKHEGFWSCMDTYKDVLRLNEMWNEHAPWKIWK